MSGEMDISRELSHLMEGMHPLTWFSYFEHFSLKGQLLVHEVGTQTYRETRCEEEFFVRSRQQILEKIEASPADRAKLPIPGDPVCSLVKR